MNGAFVSCLVALRVLNFCNSTACSSTRSTEGDSFDDELVRSCTFVVGTVLELVTVVIIFCLGGAS